MVEAAMTTRIELPGTGRELSITHNCKIQYLTVTTHYEFGQLYEVNLIDGSHGEMLWSWGKYIEGNFNGKLPVGVYLDPVRK